MRVIEKVKVGKRGDGTLIRVEGQANWYSVICVRGKLHEIATGTSDLKLAKRVHRQKLDELAADRQGLKQFTTPQHRQLQFASLYAGDFSRGEVYFGVKWGEACRCRSRLATKGDWNSPSISGSWK
jgi:hypothetical protein